ncbi:MAG: hexokinase [Spirochaetaceae bacterium]|jgi:hexokinase|nr:hexokinase [Spirochaetaceae bacterium]
MVTGFNPVEIDDFARFYGFHYDCCDSETLIRDFRIAMERGLRGQDSSLAMLPAYLSPKERPRAGKKAIALDAGGTNLRAARISFDGGGSPIIEDERKSPMPGTRGALSAAEFFSAVADFCLPLFDGGRIKGLGFCFSYPMEMKPDGDGVPLSFSKEVEVYGVTGQPIGRGLCEALAGRGIETPPRVVLLNDTVAALLCGLSQIPPRIPSKFAVPGDIPAENLSIPAGPALGFILGTGLNIAYCEKNIPKINFYSETDPQIVVCESGGFDFRYQGRLDMEFNAATKNPGAFSAEKASAGAYLGPFSLHVLKQAVRDGVLRFKKSRLLLEMESLTTRDLNEFLQAPATLPGALGCLFDADEAGAVRSLSYIESIVTERAAIIAASQLAAVVEHCASAADPLAPVRIAVEGTTFSMYHFLGEALKARFHSIMNSGSPRFCVIKAVEQASLFGAAAAALSV